jgi:hypothetical protein
MGTPPHFVDFAIMGNNMRVITLRNFRLFLMDKTIKFRDVKAVEALGGVCLISNPLIIKLKKRGRFVCAYMGNEFVGCATALPEFMLRMFDHQEQVIKSLALRADNKKMR